MITKFLSEPLKYDGAQLNGLFAYKQLRSAQDSLIAFIGETEVREGLVDYEDLLNNDFIKAKSMAHFILTIHGNDLARARLWQLLLVQDALDAIVSASWSDTSEFTLIRDGDDIFFVKSTGEQFKMSVSIATVGANQKELVHLAINIDDEGAPVKTYSLNKLNIRPEVFIHDVLRRFQNEYDGVQKTLYKVAGVA